MRKMMMGMALFAAMVIAGWTASYVAPDDVSGCAKWIVDAGHGAATRLAQGRQKREDDRIVAILRGELQPLTEEIKPMKDEVAGLRVQVDRVRDEVQQVKDTVTIDGKIFTLVPLDGNLESGGY